MNRPSSLNLSLSSVFDNAPANLTSTGDKNCRLLADDSNTVKGVKILVYSLVLIVSLLETPSLLQLLYGTNECEQLSTTSFHTWQHPTCLFRRLLTELVLGPRRWLLDGTVGLLLCKLAHFCQGISIDVSILTLVVIAIDRYRGIVFPLRYAIITPKRCKVIIGMVWLTSMGLHSPYFYTARLRSHNNTTFCIFDWAPAFDPQKTQEQYIIVIFVLVVMSPFSILIILYTRIIWILRQKGADITPNCLSQRHKENTKVIKNLCAIMIAFGFCVLPILVYGNLYYFVWKWKMPCNMEQFGFAAHFVLYSNAAITPVIYFVFNDRYRKGLKDVLRALHFWQKNFSEEIELNHQLQHQI